MSLEQLPKINFQREFVKHNDRATQSNNFVFLKQAHNLVFDFNVFVYTLEMEKPY